MPRQKTKEPQSDLPPGLSQPALRALTGAGYTRLAQLTAVTEADLLKLHGMGPKAIDTLRRALKEWGQSFAKADKKAASTKSVKTLKGR